MAHKVLNLDLSKDPRGNPIVYGRVGDSDSQIVTVNVTKKLSKWDLSDYTIAFEGETSSGKTKVIDSENIVSTPEGLKQGTFDYLFPNKAFAVPGEYKRAYFSFVNGNSRDTTGDFKFVVLQNADLTAEEAETVISEYNKLIEELRSQQSLAIDEMNQNFSAAQERIVELESQIEQALIDFENGNFWRKEESFNKEETSANVINQVIGTETVRIDFKMDFKDPENVGKLFRSQFGSLIPPTHGGWTEASQSMQDGIGILDGKYAHHSTYTNEYLALGKIEWNILDFLKEKLGESFFTDQGAVNTVEQVEIIKQKITNDSGTVWGFGSGVEGNKLTFAVWNTRRLNWSGTRSNATGEVSGITIPINNAKEYINNDGICTFVAYGNPSNISTPSTINLDYANFQFTLELSANEFIKSMIAAYCGKIVSPLEDQITDLTNRILALEGQ